MVAYLFVLGLIIGSFVNVLVYRLPRSQGVVRGRSRCPCCHKTLSWLDLVPVISFLALRGRCRYCQKPIGWQYPLVELATGGLFAAAGYFMSAIRGPDLVFSLFILVLLLALALTDWQHLILPDELIAAGIVGTLFYGIVGRWGMGTAHYNVFSPGYWGAALGFFGVLYLVWLWSKGTWIGLGDAKLMGWMGLVFGGTGAFFIFYAAIVIGGIMGLGLYLIKRADLKTKLPLGTYICLAAGWYIFQGLSITAWLRFYLIFR